MASKRARRLKKREARYERSGWCQFTMRIPQELADALDAYAAGAGGTRSGVIRVAIERMVALQVPEREGAGNRG